MIFKRIAANRIKPEGLLKKTLAVQLEGLTGHIHEIWEDLSDDNAWLGGKGEAWERGPYYLTGLILIAYQTENAEYIARARKWVEEILAGQRENGDFGPETNRDYWPRTVVLKALVSYAEMTNDERVLPFMLKYFRYQYGNLDKEPLKFWASARALEAAEAIRYCYERTGESFLIDFVKKLDGYSFDWKGFFEKMPYVKPAGAYICRPIVKIGQILLAPFDALKKASSKVPKPESREAILRFNSNPLLKNLMLTHGVNIAMALKYPTTLYGFTGDEALKALPRKGYRKLMEKHGNATGLWSTDEHLNGASPACGVELCAVVEAMYSLEEIGLFDDDKDFYTLLEFLAYNTLPATFTKDMCAHQYVQQTNQVAADVKNRVFFDVKKYGNTFGLAPNYGCCAANMHSGFPNFVRYLALRSEKGFGYIVYGDHILDTEFNGGKAVIRESGGYPYTDNITFDVERLTGSAELVFRVIDNTDFAVLLNGKRIEASGVFVRLSAREGDKIEIKCAPRLALRDNADGSFSVYYGNLLLAERLSENEFFIQGEPPFHDRGFTTQDSWNKTPLLENGKLQVLSEERSGGSLTIKVKAVTVPGWRLKKNSADTPKDAIGGEETTIELVPYGNTLLRIAQFPYLTKR